MRFIIAGFLVAALAVTAWTGLAQVEPGERGVVKRFGQIIDVVGPGLRVGLPWGIDRVERVGVDRFRQVKIGLDPTEGDDLSVAVPAGQLLTGDHNLVNVRASIDFAVEEDQVTQFVLYGDRADGLVARMSEAVLAEWVAGRGVDEVLLRGKEILPGFMASEVQRRIEPYRLGIRIHLVSIGHLNPPQQVKEAFEAVTRAQSEMETKTNEAKQEVDKRWTEAESYKNNLERRAKVDADGKRNMAHAEAEAFLARLKQVQQILRQNPDYLSALWWDEMTRVYGRMFDSGRLDLLDNRMAGDGIDILQNLAAPKKK
jgi:membrane protease subunit HflK